MYTDDGSIEIECDSPPYYIVESCQRIGLERPEDVRWCRLSQLAKESAIKSGAGWIMLFDRTLWKRLFCGGDEKICSCGKRLPTMNQYTFTLAPHNREVSYLLGQCRRCHSIFWEKLPT